MRQIKSLIVMLVIFGLAFGNLAGLALAENTMINSKIDSIVFDTDTNGNEYARIIVRENKILNGVKYEDTTAAMAFVKTVGPEGLKVVKALKPGMNLKAIVKPREYQGRTSYTILKFAK